MSGNISDKKEKLLNSLKRKGKLAVAFSGGVDSALLLKAATTALPPSMVLALTARGPFFPQREGDEAAQMAGEFGAAQELVAVDPLSDPAIAANPDDRCYHCKRQLLTALSAAATARGFTTVADGGNLDDLDDYRPGARAVKELGIISPLQEAGLTKADIRRLSADWGLATSDKPAFACLASRIPYGQRLTAESLSRVEQAEDYLLGLGLKELRVRDHQGLARIEAAPAERNFFFSPEVMDAVHQRLSALGFSQVALDLAGYRRGGLNSAVDPAAREKYRQN